MKKIISLDSCIRLESNFLLTNCLNDKCTHILVNNALFVKLQEEIVHVHFST